MRKLYWNDLNSRVLIVQKLQSEKIVAGSSDTVLGLLSPVTERGRSLLDEIKVRKDKPYIILIGSALKIYYFVSPQDFERVAKLIEFCWPGSLTLIFKAKDGLPAWMKAANGTVSLRVPKHEGLLSILSHFPGLFSTSANLGGQPVPSQVEDIDPHIMEQISALIVDFPSQGGIAVPSTILDCSGPVIKIIREGAYSIATLEEIQGASFTQ